MCGIDGVLGRHALFVIGLELDQVEVIAAFRHGGGTRQRAFRHRAERQARRQRKCLLRAVIMMSMPSSSFLIGRALTS